MSGDWINGAFEVAGGFFILLSIRRLYRDKMVRGVSWLHASFFSAWGFWNLWYYPSLDQWVSFWGGIGVVTANTTWVLMMLYYSQDMFTQERIKSFVVGRRG